MLHFTALKRYLTFVIISGGVTFYGLLLIAHDSHVSKCDGQVKGSCDGILAFGNQPEQLEHLYKCQLQNYTQIETAVCVNNSPSDIRIILIGDSRVRQLYIGLVSVFDPSYSVEVTAGKHEDLEYVAYNLRLRIQFRWAAFLDETFVQILREENSQHAPVAYNYTRDVMLLGSATWTLRYRNATVQAFQEYHRNLTDNLPVLTSIASKIPVIWILQDPVTEDKLAARRRIITNKRVNMYNNAAKEILCPTRVKLWESSREIAVEMNSSDDGLHVHSLVVNAQTQLLLNFICNRNLNRPHGYLCCS